MSFADKWTLHWIIHVICWVTIGIQTTTSSGWVYPCAACVSCVDDFAGIPPDPGPMDCTPFQCSFGCTGTCYGIKCELSNDCGPESNELRCANGCIDGIRCNGCIPPYTGDYCEHDCPANCLDDQCEQSPNGTNEIDCSLGCKPGYFGSACDIPIPCPTNCDDQGCNVTGQCYGCQSSWYGSTCNDTCVDCMDTCNFNTGRCDNCTVGRWDDLCQQTCDDLCYECVRDSGECASCQPGNYGQYCNQTCIEGCSLAGCDQMTGRCIGCTSGLYGELCNVTCPEHCDGACSRANGHCGNEVHVAGIVGGVAAAVGVLVMVGGTFYCLRMRETASTSGPNNLAVEQGHQMEHQGPLYETITDNIHPLAPDNERIDPPDGSAGPATTC